MQALSPTIPEPEIQESPRHPLTRRKFIGFTAGAGASALALDSVLIEPNRPRIVRQEIALRRWPEPLNGFRIALLSDFHYDPIFSIHPLRDSIRMVNDLRPDLIALTGDFVSVPYFYSDDAKAARDAGPCAQFLRQMAATHGLWAVLGNHDYNSDPQIVTGLLRDEKIQVLIDQSVPIERNGARFWLAGVNDVLSGTASLSSALQGIPADEPVVLMAHEPDYADYVSRYAVDLQLSGHTHGGQVRLPFLPPLYLPELARKYIWGRYQIGPLALYTNPGIGTVGVPVRFNCPPEITLLTLTRAG